MDPTRTPPVIGDDSLKNWVVIGSGGFGQIHMARHVKWGLDVAIKLLHYDAGSRSSCLLLQEAELMRQGGSPYVLRVLGVYRGRPPSSSSGPSSSQLGLVMEFMERGSLAALQEALSGPPPLPLVCRLAHQIALGMNFLHHLPRALLHLDLKPSNVLLDDSLNAKLTDFGLARVYHSLSKAPRGSSGEEGGTVSYMPPEAFHMSYKPTRASDIYSYGILLWSIVTGQQPYANVQSSMVRFRIPEGDRPPLGSVDSGQSPEHGQLVELMERCWNTVPQNRPSFLESLTVTEGLFEKHKPGVNDAVYQVLTKLDLERTTNSFSTLCVQPTSGPPGSLKESANHVKTGPPPKQETGGGLPSNQRDRERDTDRPSSQPKDDPSTDRKPSPYAFAYDAKRETPSPTPIVMEDRKPPFAVDSQRAASQFQRQSSHPLPSNGYTCISMSNVYGCQIGNSNHMFLEVPKHESDVPLQRQRHRNPTAPSRVNLPPTHEPAGHKDKS